MGMLQIIMGLLIDLIYLCHKIGSECKPSISPSLFAGLEKRSMRSAMLLGNPQLEVAQTYLVSKYAVQCKAFFRVGRGLFAIGTIP